MGERSERGEARSERESVVEEGGEFEAMEGEIARSIRTISGVKAARVHLVLPRREPFARERQEAQASVMLTTTGAKRNKDCSSLSI